MTINVYYIKGIKAHIRQLVFSNGRTKWDASITDWTTMKNVNEVYEVSMDVLCAALEGTKPHLLEHVELDVKKLYMTPRNNIVRFW